MSYGAYNRRHGVPIPQDGKGGVPRGGKGFVLIELIVVLVIIVALAAILLPFAFNRIDEAKTNAEIAETRTIAVAVQTMMTMTYERADDDGLLDRTDLYDVRLTSAGREKLNDLTGMDAGPLTHIKIDDRNAVNGFVYRTERGSQVVYDEGAYSVVELY
jgi:prepilin-type N-terminal cleavage/methylation domain-containing protein